MPDTGFRAAQAWVEITTDLDGARIERAARDAANRADAQLSGGMEDTGRRISDTLGKSGEQGGERLTRSVEGRLRDSRGRFLAAGSKVGDDVGEGIEGSGRRNRDRPFRPLLDGARKSGGGAGAFFSDSMIKAAAPVIAANAPTLGAAMAGGIVGGLAIGTIGLGVALALKDPVIKEAATATGADIGGVLKGSAEPFKAELLGVFADSRSAFDRWAPDLRSIFADASKQMRPLTTGLTNMVEETLPGIRKAVHNAEPAVNSLRMMFERTGDAVGDMFETLADDAKEGASAIDDVALSVENLIRTATAITHGASAVKGWLDQLDIAIDKGRYWMEDNSHLAEGFEALGLQLDLTADGFDVGTKEAEAYRKATIGTAEAADFAILKAAGMTDAQITGVDASGRYRAAMDEAAGAVEALRGEANGAIPGVRDLSAIMDDWAGKSISVEQAQSRLEAAIDSATAAAKENGAGIDRNKPKQRANRDALIEIASAAREAAAKVFEQTHSQEAASKATERGRAAFLKAAEAMHVSKEEATKLANELFGIPSPRPKVTVNDAQAKAALAAIKNGIATIHDKTVTVTVKYETHGSIQGEHIIGQGTQLKAEGGEIMGGSGIRDDVPVLATSGEWMIRKQAVRALERAFGPGIMHRLNNADRPERWHNSHGTGYIPPANAGPIDSAIASIGGVERQDSYRYGATPRASYHFAPGAFTLDVSKIQSVSDLVRMVEGLTGTARAYSAGSV